MSDRTTGASSGPRIVIVGGVAGGASAAARARRLAENAEIVVFERGPYASFANCGLPYYVGGEIAERDKLLVAGSERLAGWLRLDVRTGCEVKHIDRAAQEVVIDELTTGRTYRERYDFLVLAPGAVPLRPLALLRQVGDDHPRVVSLRNIPDVDRIKQYVDAGVKRAVVLGGGFIGLEVTEQLVRRGVPTVLVELLPQVMPPFDAEMVSAAHAVLREHGVALNLGDGVDELLPGDGEEVVVRLKSGKRIEADLVLLAIGVRPESALAATAGLDLNERGAIQVDGQMRTSDPAIYAVGDAVEVDDPIGGGKTQIPLAGPANRQGRLVADHCLSRAGAIDLNEASLRYRGSQGTSIVRVFDLALGMTGLSEKALERLGWRLHQEYEVVYVHPFHHATYYPGARQLTLKLIFARPDGRILGAQAVGSEGIDKRIDVIAMCIQMRGTVFDLEQAELCYAPQFGSAKDAVNMAGFQATNVLRGITRVMTPGELIAMRDQMGPDAVTVLDVRTTKEFDAGHLAGAVNIPLDQLRERLDEVPHERPVVTYCAVGMRGYLAQRILAQRGLNDVVNLSGGYRTWRQFVDA